MSSTTESMINKPNENTALISDEKSLDTKKTILFTFKQIAKLGFIASDHTMDYFFNGRWRDPRQVAYSWIPFTLATAASVAAASLTGGIGAVPAAYFTFTTVNGTNYEVGKQLAKQFNLPGNGYFEGTQSFSERFNGECYTTSPKPGNNNQV